MTGPQDDLDDTANECIVGIVRAGEAFVALANQSLNGYQLSPAARQALAILDGAGEPLSPTEIARRAGAGPALRARDRGPASQRDAGHPGHRTAAVRRRPDPDTGSNRGRQS